MAEENGKMFRGKNRNEKGNDYPCKIRLTL